MQNDPDDYMNDFNQAKIMFKDASSAMLIQEYQKGLAENGTWTKLAVGDTVVLKSMFLPQHRLTPPWAVQEAIILECTLHNSKVMIETKEGMHPMWIPNWVITDHIANKTPSVKTKFKKLAHKLAINNINPIVETMQDNFAQELTDELTRIINEERKKDPIEAKAEKPNKKPKSKSKKKKQPPFTLESDEEYLPGEADAVIIFDEDTGEEFTIDPELVDAIKKAIKKGDI